MKKKSRAILINAVERTITEVEVSGLADLQKAVGGYIERGGQLENGDDIYVNEEGLLNGTENYFYLEGMHQPFAGNGILLGHTSSGNNAPAKSKIEDLKIKFMNRDELAFLLSRSNYE